MKSIIVQNEDDLAFFSGQFDLNKNELILVEGSGVEVDKYTCKFSSKKKIVLFPARVLKDKGIREFVTAVAKLERSYSDWQFLVAGADDYDNPTALSKTELNELKELSSIRWLGHVDCIEKLYMQARIVCLPSYREGLPKSLLEAGAASCAIVTTNVTGCRSAIEDGLTGFLVPAKDTKQLAWRLEQLMTNEEKCELFGLAGRDLVMRKFSLEEVVKKFSAIYQR